MYHKIELKGFQSHKDSSLELSPGLNIVVGASDSGKTAILRAIRWAVHNEPLGDSFINNDMGSALVGITTKKGCVIRKKSKSENSYYVNDKTFQGFGTKVPEEVADIVGMQKVLLGDTQYWLNYAMQLDPPFMLSETAGQAARILGKLAGTEFLDLAGKLSNSDLISFRSEKKVKEAEVKSLQEKLDNYSYIQETFKQILIAKEFLKTVENKKALCIALAEIGKKLNNTNRLIETIKAALEHIRIPDIHHLVEYNKDYIILTGIEDNLSRKNYTILTTKLVLRNIILTDLSPVKNYIQKKTEIATLYTALLTAQKTKKDITTVLPLINFSEAEVTLRELTTQQILWVAASKIDRQYKFISEQSNRSKTILDALMLRDVTALQIAYRQAEKLSDCNKKTSGIKVSTAAMESNIQNSSALIVKTAQEFKNFLESVGICPTCGGEFTESRIQNIVGEAL